MSISHLFPEEGPTLSLNFAGSRTLDPRITFTRTSTATVMGREGLIEIVPANTPRFDHRYVNGEIESLGLLIEESRSNLLTGSEDFGPSYWVPLNSVSTSLNAIVSPDGNTTADKFIENTNTTHKVLARNFTLTASTTYTYSLFVKVAERNALMIHVRKSDYSDRFGASFNLSTQVVTTETSGLGVLNSTDIKKYPNDWYRISITGNIGTNTSAVVTMYLIGSGSAFDIGYTGDGTSGLYIWGAQLEQGAFPTSYIPTSGSTATRTADNASMVGENFSSWYNQTEGTFLGNVRREYAVPASDYPVIIDARVPNTDLIQFSYLTEGLAGCYILTNSTVQSELYPGSLSGVRRRRICLAYANNNFGLVVNGGTLFIDNVGTPPSNLNAMYIGSVQGSSQILNGTIAQLTYYPRRLTNTQLQTLTK